jgi:hypothetical protein
MLHYTLNSRLDSRPAVVAFFLQILDQIRDLGQPHRGETATNSKGANAEI